MIQESDPDYKMSKKKIKNIWNCKRCFGLTFPTSTILKQHRKEVHPRKFNKDVKCNYYYDKEQDLYSCNTCDLECESKEEMEKHALEHCEIYTCKECNEQFHELCKYSLHIYTHTNESMYSCGACKFTTKGKFGLLSHIKYVHLKQYKYHCTDCPTQFSDVTRFNEHVEWHKSGSSHECVVCKKKYTYSGNLLMHQLRCHRVFIDGTVPTTQCPTCKKPFSKVKSLQKHMLTHTQKKERLKAHLCDMCGKGFSVKTKLREHYRKHTGEKPFKCSYCEKCFTISYYLTLHERTHNGEKPYMCEFCGKSFNQGGTLKAHKRTHTGDRPFTCTICRNGFTSKASLNAHLIQCGNKELGNYVPY